MKSYYIFALQSTVVQSQKAVTAHFSSKQLLPIDFAEQSTIQVYMHVSNSFSRVVISPGA